MSTSDRGRAKYWPSPVQCAVRNDFRRSNSAPGRSWRPARGPPQGAHVARQPPLDFSRAPVAVFFLRRRQPVPGNECLPATWRRAAIAVPPRGCLGSLLHRKPRIRLNAFLFVCVSPDAVPVARVQTLAGELGEMMRDTDDDLDVPQDLIEALGTKKLLKHRDSDVRHVTSPLPPSPTARARALPAPAAAYPRARYTLSLTGVRCLSRVLLAGCWWHAASPTSSASARPTRPTPRTRTR